MPSSQTQPQTNPAATPTPADADPAADKQPVSPLVAPTVVAKVMAQRPSMDFQKVMRSYLLPLAVLSVFGAMLIFLVIPKVSEILAQLDETGNLYEQARTMDSQLQRLNTLNQQSERIKTDLALINQIAPSGATEVVNFQTKLLDMAREIGLTVQQSSLEESVKQTEDQTSVSNLGIIEIPSTFSLRGGLGSLQNFIQQIQQLTDFVIIGEMSLRFNEDLSTLAPDQVPADDWTLIITLIKYQFLTPNAQNQLEQVFSQIPPEAKINLSVIEFAAKKFATNTNTSTEVDLDPSTSTPTN